jgi:D-sedoheptulose 7-phosphate isomerase
MILTVIEQHIAVINQLKTMTDKITAVAEVCSRAIKAGKRIYLMGNGGSAADSQHIAAEFVGRFQIERQSLPALALTTDTSILTAVGNDYGFDEIFARQIRAFVQPDDVVIGISTSGNSANILSAMVCAQQQGGVTVAFTGQGGGKLAACCHYCLAVPSPITARVQEAHILIGHILCQYVDEVLYGDQ